MTNFSIPLHLAPTNLTQPIFSNWNVTLFNIDLGTSTNPEVEDKALKQVGSYGRQIGRLAEALEVVIHTLKLLDHKDLTPDQRDALQVFLGDVSEVRKIKASLNPASPAPLLPNPSRRPR